MRLGTAWKATGVRGRLSLPVAVQTRSATSALT